MTFSTLIHAQPKASARPRRSLVLMGGGARTAYQVGVLLSIAAQLRQMPDTVTGTGFPFQILVGTSAGAINAAFLASRATHGLAALTELEGFWRQLRSHHVYDLEISPWMQSHKFLAALNLWRNVRAHGAILNTMPSVDTLHRAISLPGIEQSLAAGAIESVAVTASSYTTGVHWTFCQTAANADAANTPWERPGRRAEFQPITIEHLMASSAIPFLFPSAALWVNGRREFFGDGSMRQVSPLSPAIHLGADRVLVIGVGQPQRSGLGGSDVDRREPTLSAIAGHAMASVFHDTLQADVEQTQRVTRTMRQMPPAVLEYLPYRAVDVTSVQPSESLDSVAKSCQSHLPRSIRSALSGLGALRGGGALASYLLFEPVFIEALVTLGMRDAQAMAPGIHAFFTNP